MKVATTIVNAMRDIKERYWADCTGFHVLIMVYTGYWPLRSDEENKFLMFMQYCPFFTLGFYTFGILITLYDLTFKLGDYVLFSETFTIIITLSKAIVASLLACFAKKECTLIFSILENFTQYIVEIPERVIFMRCKKKVKWYTILSVVCWASYSLILTIKPMFEPERRLPFHYNLPLESPLNEIWYIIVIGEGLATSILLAVFDSGIVTSFIFLTGFIEILQLKLEYGKFFALKMLIKKMGERDKDASDVIAIFRRVYLEKAMKMEEISKNDSDANLIEEYFLASKISELQELEEIEPFERVTGNIRIASILAALEEDTPDNVQELDTPVVVDETNTDEEAAEEGVNSTTDVDFKVNKHDLDHEMVAHLVNCAKIHVEIIGVINEMQLRTDALQFLVLVLGAILVCLTLFLVTTAPTWSADMFIWFGYLMFALQELGGFCWPASQLQFASVRVSDALYFSNWLEASPAYKRYMLIMMSRAVKPIQTLTMGFLPFNMEMFTKVLNSAYSYFSLMKRLNSSI